jgi:cytochrome bd-type quinol oxidase subunit 1
MMTILDIFILLLAFFYFGMSPGFWIFVVVIPISTALYIAIMNIIWSRENDR